MLHWERFTADFTATTTTTNVAFFNGDSVNNNNAALDIVTLNDNAALGAAGGDGTTNYGSGQGGGINSIGTLTVRDTTLTDNLAQGAPLAATVEPSQSVLSNNATAGGGIFCLDHQQHHRQSKPGHWQDRRCGANGSTGVGGGRRAQLTGIG